MGVAFQAASGRVIPEYGTILNNASIG